MKRTLGLAVVAVAATSCVGSISQSEFDAEVRSRGGGVGQALVLEAVEAVAGDGDVGAVELRSLAARPSQVHLEVRVPGTERDLDSYAYGTSGLYGRGGLSGPEPVPVPAEAPPMETQVFRADEAGLEHLDGMVDDALDQAALAGGYTQSVTIARAPLAGPVPGTAGDPAAAGDRDPAADAARVLTAITVTDGRSSFVMTFAADGSLVGVEQS